MYIYITLNIYSIYIPASPDLSALCAVRLNIVQINAMFLTNSMGLNSSKLFDIIKTLYSPITVFVFVEC